MILRGPGIPAGSVVDGQVGLIDVAPTLLSLAGLPTDRRVAGVDRSPLARGEGSPRESVWSTTDPFFPGRQLALRGSGRKVLLQSDSIAVHDLRADPSESIDLGVSGMDRAALEQEYAATLTPFRAHRVDAPAPPAIDPAEAARLEALGYLVPGDSPPPAGR